MSNGKGKKQRQTCQPPNFTCDRKAEAGESGRKREGPRGCHAQWQSREKSNPLQLAFDPKRSAAKMGFVLGSGALFPISIEQASNLKNRTS